MCYGERSRRNPTKMERCSAPDRPTRAAAPPAVSPERPDLVAIVTYRALRDEILAAPATVRVVAVDGPSGAGKSTFARHLARALDDAPIIEIDDFLSWGDLDSWWPRLEDQVLHPLLDGRAAVYQQRDWDNDPLGHGLGGWRTVPPAPVVILEGLTSSRQAVADRLALAVWVDAPADLRLERGVARDGEQMRDIWVDSMRLEDAFFACDRTRERAQLSVDAAPTTTHSPTVEFIGERNT
jgi:energy-coupling factor transporter ATP-binding protein EcfA2